MLNINKSIKHCDKSMYLNDPLKTRSRKSVYALYDDTKHITVITAFVLECLFTESTKYIRHLKHYYPAFLLHNFSSPFSKQTLTPEHNCCLSLLFRPQTAEFRSVSPCPGLVPIRCQSDMQMSSWLLLWCHFMAALHPSLPECTASHTASAP